MGVEARAQGYADLQNSNLRFTKMNFGYNDPVNQSGIGTASARRVRAGRTSR